MLKTKLGIYPSFGERKIDGTRCKKSAIETNIPMIKLRMVVILAVVIFSGKTLVMNYAENSMYPTLCDVFAIN